MSGPMVQGSAQTCLRPELRIDRNVRNAASPQPLRRIPSELSIPSRAALVPRSQAVLLSQIAKTPAARRRVRRFFRGATRFSSKRSPDQKTQSFDLPQGLRAELRTLAE